MITDVTDSLRGIKSGGMEADKTVIISRVMLFSKFVIMKESNSFQKKCKRKHDYHHNI